MSCCEAENDLCCVLDTKLVELPRVFRPHSYVMDSVTSVAALYITAPNDLSRNPQVIRNAVPTTRAQRQSAFGNNVPRVESAEVKDGASSPLSSPGNEAPLEETMDRAPRGWGEAVTRVAEEETFDLNMKARCSSGSLGASHKPLS